jgi:hypothetical protein
MASTQGLVMVIDYVLRSYNYTITYFRMCQATFFELHYQKL